MACDKTDCSNKDKVCHLCIPKGRLYKTGKKPKKRKLKRRDALGKVKKYQKDGMEFQSIVRKKYNRYMRRADEARETPNSGAIWTMPGDIYTEDALIECKQRGQITSRGEKQITITREMLLKIAKEAGTTRIPLLAFGFKGHPDEVYMMGDFNVFLELIQINKQLKDRIAELEARHGKPD